MKITVLTSYSLKQTYYNTLVPNKTYVVSVWLRQLGLANKRATFGLSGFYNFALSPFNLTTSWQQYTTTFSVSTIYSSGTQVGTMYLSFTGPGEVG